MREIYLLVKLNHGVVHRSLMREIYLLVKLSLVTSRKQPMENPSGNVGLDSGAFLLTTELFERTNQIVAFPITQAAH